MAARAIPDAWSQPTRGTDCSHHRPPRGVTSNPLQGQSPTPHPRSRHLGETVRLLQDLYTNPSMKSPEVPPGFAPLTDDTDEATMVPQSHLPAPANTPVQRVVPQTHQHQFSLPEEANRASIPAPVQRESLPTAHPHQSKGWHPRYHACPHEHAGPHVELRLPHLITLMRSSQSTFRQ